MKKYISKPYGYTPLLATPDLRGKKLCDLNPNATVTLPDIHLLGFELVEYAAENKTMTGWVESKHLDIYRENLPRNCVDLTDIATPALNDAEQYVIWHERKQVNMCGEICVCYLLGHKLSALLELWEHKEPSLFKRIFGSGMAGGTYNADLQTIFEMFGESAMLINDKTHKYYTPQIVADLRGAIVGVKISSVTGRLTGSGVGHWVVIVDIMQERFGYGMVTIYNPFSNRHEIYSYAEFLASARTPFGVMKNASLRI